MVVEAAFPRLAALAVPSLAEGLDDIAPLSAERKGSKGKEGGCGSSLEIDPKVCSYLNNTLTKTDARDLLLSHPVRLSLARLDKGREPERGESGGGRWMSCSNFRFAR